MNFDESNPQNEAEARALADRKMIEATAAKVEKMSSGVADTIRQGQEKINEAVLAFEKARKEEAEQRAEFMASLEKAKAAAAAPASASVVAPKVGRWADFCATRLAGMKDEIDARRFFSIGEGQIPRMLMEPGIQFADQAHIARFDDPTPQTLSVLAGMTPAAYQFTPVLGSVMARPFSAEAPSEDLQAASITYPRETESSRLSAIRTHVTTQGSSGDGILVVQSTAGMYVGMKIFVYSTHTLTRTIQSVDSSTQITCTENNGETVPDNSVVVSEEYTATAEGVLAPYTLFGTSSVTASMYGDKVLVHLTRESMIYQNILQIMQTRMPEKAARSLSKKLLYGTGGTVPTIPGIMNTTGVQDYDWSDGTVGDTRADAVLRAWAQVRTGGMTRAWCNIDDMLSMATAKGATDGHYVMSTLAPVSLSLSEGGLRLGWIPLSIDASFVAGDFLVIDHAAAHSVLRDARFSGLDIGYMDSDFGKGELHARHWQQCGQKLLDFGAWVVGDWDAAPSA